jgi:hypothetical protein
MDPINPFKPITKEVDLVSSGTTKDGKTAPVVRIDLVSESSNPLKIVEKETKIVATGSARNGTNAVDVANTMAGYYNGTNLNIYPPYKPDKLYYSPEEGNFPIVRSSTGGLYKTVIQNAAIRPAWHMHENLGWFQAEKVGQVQFAKMPNMHITSKPSLEPLQEKATDEYPAEYKMGASATPGNEYGKVNDHFLYQFRAAVTFVNPENNPAKRQIMDYGLENAEKDISIAEYGIDDPMHPEPIEVRKATDERNATPEVPISPLHTFTRSYPERARNVIMSCYNRTRIPIADVEHRKAFRYIFITRPECYLMSSMDKPSLQAAQDEDMNTCLERAPHILQMLSPVYVTGNASAPSYANWNFLLSNRVQGLNAGGNTINLVDTMTKSVRGATVIPGKNLTTNVGGTLDLQFMDDKYMDVYEMLRIWMLYIHKRRTGQFFPPFNNYAQINGFPTASGVGTGAGGFMLTHPYDRALEYCASIFDIITNETGSKILYWCKYYGVYPTNISSALLSNASNSALTQTANVNATFQYQYKQENLFKNLVEFNFNAGIVDSTGRMRDNVAAYLRDSIPFLYREDGKGGTNTTSPRLKNYIGAASMFTGAPYITTEVSGDVNPWAYKSSGRELVQANLRFIPLHHVDERLDAVMNSGITNEWVPSANKRFEMTMQY